MEVPNITVFGNHTSCLRNFQERDSSTPLDEGKYHIVAPLKLDRAVEEIGPAMYPHQHEEPVFYSPQLLSSKAS